MPAPRQRTRIDAVRVLGELYIPGTHDVPSKPAVVGFIEGIEHGHGTRIRIRLYEADQRLPVLQEQCWTTSQPVHWVLDDSVAMSARGNDGQLRSRASG